MSYVKENFPLVGEKNKDFSLEPNHDEIET